MTVFLITMKFYKNKRLHNKEYLINYIVEYIYFINITDGNLFLDINNHQLQYKNSNKLMANNFLLN